MEVVKLLFQVKRILQMRVPEWKKRISMLMRMEEEQAICLAHLIMRKIRSQWIREAVLLMLIHF